jgi:hypothetical protein
MAFRHSYWTYGLTLLCGGCACFILASPADAGDKIEFSSPANALRVPQREVEKKDNKSPNRPPQMASFELERPPGFVSYEETTIITSRSADMDKHAWDLHSWSASLLPDKDKKSTSMLERFLNLDTPASETNSNTGSGGLNENGRDKDRREFGYANNSFSRRNGDNQENSDISDDSPFRNGTSILFGQEHDRKDERLGQQYADSLASIPWMKSPAEHDAHETTALDRMHHGEFVEFSGGFGTTTETPGLGGMAEEFNRAGDPSHDPAATAPPGFSEYSTLPGSLPDRGESQLFGSSGMTSAWAPEPNVSAPSVHDSAPALPSWSGGNQRSEPTAVLSFPHRPGDPF